jgi:hypothetical protein
MPRGLDSRSLPATMKPFPVPIPYRLCMPAKRSAVTIHDVARAAGVSVSTASRVLNHRDDVAPATYARVRQVMEELNFTASLAAKSLRSRVTHVIGLVLPDLTKPFMGELVEDTADLAEVVRRELTAAGYQEARPARRGAGDGLGRGLPVAGAVAWPARAAGSSPSRRRARPARRSWCTRCSRCRCWRCCRRRCSHSSPPRMAAAAGGTLAQPRRRPGAGANAQDDAS